MRRGYALPLLRSQLGPTSASRKKIETKEKGRKQSMTVRAKCNVPYVMTLSLKNRYAPLMRQVLKVWPGQIERWKPKQ